MKDKKKLLILGYRNISSSQIATQSANNDVAITVLIYSRTRCLNISLGYMS